MAKKTVKALIIARGGSERVKGKNVRPFADTRKSLLQIKVEQLKRLEGLDDIVVNSEDEAILRIAELVGATPHPRDPYYAKSDTPMNQVYRHVAQNTECDEILFCNCTSPLILDESLQKLIDQPLEMVDSINSTNHVHKFIWQVLPFHDCTPLYDAHKQPRSQDIRDIIQINFACAKIERLYMAKNGKVVAINWLPFPLSEEESVDIDTEIDWKLAEILWKNKN